MKLSLKFRDETHHKNPLLRAKIPVTILGLPFLSGVVAGDATDLSFSLRSNFTTGPSLCLSYHPTATTTTTTSSNLPFSLSLKSGIGLFGSHHDSPLIFTATFNPTTTNSITPIFSLQIKPQFGNFFLSKSVDSLSGPPQNGGLGNGSGPKSDFLNGLGHGSGYGGGVLSGIVVAARTGLPLTRKAAANFRWGVNFPREGGSGSSSSLPMLVMNKVSLERVDEVKSGEEGGRVVEAKAKAGDLELLKGMCGWMRREVEDLQRENREMKVAMGGMKFKGSGSRGRGDEREIGRKRGAVGEGLNEFEKWRSKKGDVGEENVHKEKEVKKTGNRMNDVEIELQKAIMAASS